MRFKISLPVFVGILLLLSNCEIEKSPYKKSNEIRITKITDNNMPTRTYVDPDSIIVRIPGQGDTKQPERIVSEIPKKVSFLGNNNITPGISMLKQSVKEKLSDEPQRKSKKPVIHKYQGPRKGSIVSVNENDLVKIKLLPRLVLEFDSVKYRKKIAIENELFSIQNGDTILPPISLLVENPQVTKALPFYYKENAILDICILETNQELPNPYIRSIAMDNNDLIWLLTHTGGLISYDGQYFSQYNDPRRLTAQSGLSMIIDSKGKIWTGTMDGGVFCFDGVYNTQYTNNQGLISENINAIIEDKLGNIWCGTTGGLIRIDDSTVTSYTTDNGLAYDYIFSLFEDSDGNIWIGTFGGGVSMFNGEEFLTITEEDGLCHNHVLSIEQDHLGNFWFGTYGGGVSKFNGDTFTNYSIEQGLASDVILSIKEDEDENICFGTYGNGVSYFDGKAFTNYSTLEGLSYDYIRTMTNDNKGNLWIGTDGSGLSKINVNGFNFYTTHAGLSDDNIGSIFQDREGRLFFAPFEGGVSIFDKPKQPGQLENFIDITTDNGLVNNIVTAITQDDNNNYWFGAFRNGVSKLDSKSFETGKLVFTNYSEKSGLNSNVVRAIYVDNNSNIWFGTEGGATKFDGQKLTTITTKNGLGNNKVLTIYQDRNEHMWFGTMDGGVSCLRNDTLITYTTDQGLACNTVWTINEDKNGFLWFGTEKKGISGFNGSTFRTIDVSNGLSSNDVFSAIIDKNDNLWVGTIVGLNKIILPDGEFFNLVNPDKCVPEISVFGRLDGLMGLDFSSNSVYIDDMNCIWWGTDKALTMLDLNKFKLFPEQPKPHLRTIGINGNLINFKEIYKKGQLNSGYGIRFDSIVPFSNIPIGLNLPHNMNYISFGFTATDWSSPNHIQYSYKIEGFDTDWSAPSKENIADYRNLPPGKYVFKLRAKGKSESWSESISYPLVIRNPWYRTIWAGLLYLVLLVFFVWLLVRWRVSIVQRQKSVLAGMVNERTKDLDKALLMAEQAAEAKNQFIATISHELRTPLNAIMGLSHLAINNTKDPNQEDYLKKIDRSANTLLSLINEILDFSKIEAGKMELENVDFDLDMVINSIIELNSHSAKEKNLDFVVNVSPDIPRLLIGDPLRLGQIITNLCNNAIKFTSDGEVVVNIELEEIVKKNELYIQVSVKDTGIGISDDEMQTLFEEFRQADASTTRKYGGTGLGLSICKLIIETMNGQIWLESEVGVGTTFFFDFKVGVQTEEKVIQRQIPEELKHYNILVCDDNKESLMSICNVLKHYSLNVFSATSGDEVLSLVKEKQIDLLLIDLDLKGKKAIDIILSIRSDEAIPPVKTIILTDSLSGKESLESNIKGIDGYILKPAIASYVIEKVLAVFGMEKLPSSMDKKANSWNEVLKNKLSDKRVLIAEDNELNQQVVVELVHRAGIKVDCVINGKLAVSKASENKYDMILMDLHMPIMDGFDASSKLREMGVDIPIVAITADAMDTVKKKCKNAGIDDIVTKPIIPELLYEKLLYWIIGESGVNLVMESEKEQTGINLSGISPEDLDILSGIKRLGNDKHLYFKMLKKFLASVDDSMQKLGNCIENNDMDNASLVSHSIKGESGNLGAKAVSKCAGDLQDSIAQKNDMKITILYNELGKHVNRIIPVINELPSGELESITVTDFRPQKQIIHDMIECIAIKDPRIFDLLDELEDSGVISKKLKEIKTAIKVDDVENAILLLKELP